MALPDGMGSCAMCVEIMTGTAWTDVSDNMSVVEAPEQTRANGEAYVFGEDTAVLGWGKLGPTQVTVRGIWAEGTADPFYTIYLAHTTACGALCAVRWSPAGCATSHDSFATSTTVSKVISLTYPNGDASSGDVIMYQFVVKSPDVTRAAWS